MQCITGWSLAHASGWYILIRRSPYNATEVRRSSLAAWDVSNRNRIVPPECSPLGAETLESESPSPSAGRSTRLVWVLAFLLVALATPYLTREISYAVNQGRERAKVEASRELLGDINETTASFSLVAQAVGPSVVHIDTIRLTRPPGYGDEFEALYNGNTKTYESRGQGSGVIIDDDGYILTNFHVIRGPAKIDVSLSDGRRFENAEVIGADPLTDLAVLKIPGKNLIEAPWGSSEDVNVGDWVLAVGNPYGLDRSVTAGIVSAEQRSLSNSPYQHFLQTDAAVNPGNSGGPLVNLKGEVIGITTAILGNSYRGISFAIPADMAKEVYERLKSTGKVARGWLGVALSPLSEDIAEKLGIEELTGALVTGLIAGAPAQAAGILPGDVIVQWQGQPVHEPRDLVLLVASSEVGSTVKVVVIRAGKRIELKIDVAERPTTLDE